MSRPSSQGDEKTNKNVETAEYPSNQKRVLIMAALYLAAFLVTLVRRPPFLEVIF